MLNAANRLAATVTFKATIAFGLPLFFALLARWLILTFTKYQPTGWWHLVGVLPFFAIMCIALSLADNLSTFFKDMHGGEPWRLILRGTLQFAPFLLIACLLYFLFWRAAAPAIDYYFGSLAFRHANSDGSPDIRYLWGGRGINLIASSILPGIVAAAGAWMITDNIRDRFANPEEGDTLLLRR